MPTQSYALPANLGAWFIGNLSPTQRVVGGASGLFDLSSTPPTRLSTSAVGGLVAMPPFGVVLVEGGAIAIQSDRRRRSPLTAALGAPATRAARRGAELWLGTEASLFYWTADRLFEVPGLGAVDAIETSSAAQVLVVKTPETQWLLRDDGAGFSAADLSDEDAPAHVVTGPSNRVFGVDEGRLLERVSRAGRVVWVAAALTPDRADPGARDVEALATDPTTGALWVVTSTALHRLDGARHVSRLARPAGLGRVARARVGDDGGLWVADTTSLVRVGGTDAPITFAAVVAKFNTDNCARCHSERAQIGRPFLDTYAQWVANVDRVVLQLELGRMPPGGAALIGGTVDTIKAWRSGGLRP